MRGADELAAQHQNGRVQALAAHRVMEAAEDLDLLDQLAIADEGALAPGPVDVALFGQVGHRLPDRREADAERLGELTFPRQLLARCSQPSSTPCSTATLIW